MLLFELWKLKIKIKEMTDNLSSLNHLQCYSYLQILSLRRDSQPSVWAAAKLGRRRIRRKENLIWDPTKADKILLAISNGDRILLSARDSISFNLKPFVQHSLLTKMITAWPLSNNSAFIWKFRLTATMIDFKKDASCTDCLNLMKAMHNMINWHFVLQNCTASCSLRDFM